MAKKKNVAASPAVTPAATAAAVAQVDRKAALLDELKGLVNQYNESAEFSEFKTMKKIDEKTSEKLAEYVVECENDCFNALLKTENPMLEAAKLLVFETVAVKDQKQEEGGTKRVIETVYRKIDPMRLHKKAVGMGTTGIGANKLWWSLIERLSMLLTAATVVDLNAVSTTGEQLDPTKIRNTIAMSEEAKKLTMKAEGDLNNDDILLSDVQAVIDAMLGEGYSATPKMVKYLRKTHVNIGRGAMTVKVARESNMRWIVLNVCHAAIYPEKNFIVEYKQAKIG